MGNKSEAPLIRNDVDVKDGEYLIAINGHEVQPDESVDSLLLNLANQQVQLTVCSKPDRSDTRDVQVKVLASDQELRYRDWFRRNLEYVEKKSNGTIGYLHLPDIGAPGLIEFVKGLYPQIKKDALVIDVRDNGGGFVSQMIIERLNRKVSAHRPAPPGHQAPRTPNTRMRGTRRFSSTNIRLGWRHFSLQFPYAGP